MKIRSSTQNSPFRRSFLVCVAVLLLLILTITSKHSGRSNRNDQGSSINDVHQVESKAQTPSIQDLFQSLDQACFAIKQSRHNPAKSREVLRALKIHLFATPKEIAGAAIANWIHEGANASTGIEFSIESCKSLAGHPSLRVALLDWLLEIDPALALTLSKDVLEKPTEPDEWSVCLRNVAVSSKSGEERDYLISKTTNLIRNPAWTGNPSVSYLESFDILSYVNATESVPLLAGIACETSTQGRVRAHAATLTLDRLAFAKPVETLRLLEANLELSRQRGKFVACLFARADVADPLQKSLVRSYLIHPSRTQSELETFSAVFPNANFTVSRNLISINQSLTGAQISARDSAAMTMIGEWSDDPAMTRIRWVCDAIERRVARFVKRETRTPVSEP